jgi:hypothetical protein
MLIFTDPMNKLSLELSPFGGPRGESAGAECRSERTHGVLAGERLPGAEPSRLPLLSEQQARRVDLMTYDLWFPAEEVQLLG